MIRVPIPNLTPGELRLEGAVARYLAHVLRLRAGDTFVAFDPATGSEASAVMVWAEHDVVTVRFNDLREGTVRANRPLVWLQALAKGHKCDAIVRDATELGATQVLVVPTARSVVRLDDVRSAERQARWARIAQEAARQCGRSDPPTVETLRGWGDALDRVPDDGARFCLWEGAAEPLASGLLEALARDKALAFACGPEGGLEAREAEHAQAAGWRLVSLGRFVLRTETVAAAVLGAVRVWGDAFGGGLACVAGAQKHP